MELPTDETTRFSMHHVGCAVSSIDDSLAHYTGPLGFQRVSPKIQITSQHVAVCFVETSPGVYVELIEPTSEASTLHNLLKKRVHWYHVCYSVADVPAAVESLRTQRFRSVTMFDSEAFEGTPCAFLYTPDLVLVELCTAGAFTLL